MVAVAAVRRTSWLALLACALLLLGSAAAASGPHWESDDPNVVIAMRRAAAADRRMREWRAAHANKTQRPVRERCDAAGACVREGIQVALMEGYGIVFCRDCPNAHVEGSFIPTWESWRHPEGFHVDAELVFAVPNDARSEILNTIGGTVVLVDRGTVPFVEKVMHCQDAGAVGVIVIDDGRCTEDFDCGVLGRKVDGYLAARDAPAAWESVFIPSVLITKRQGERLRGLLGLSEMVVAGLGRQLFVDEIL